MNNIKELCKDISFRNLYNWNNIPQKILNNCTYSLGINNDEVILFYDTSIFENGKVGLAVCNNGLYWKNSFCSPRYLTWNAFRKRKILYDDNHIYIGEDENCLMNENADKICSFLNNLKFNLKVDNVVEKTQGVFGFIKEAIDFISQFDSEGNSIEDIYNEEKMIETDSTNTYNDQKMIETNSNKVIEVECYEENYNKVNYEELVPKIENIKSMLKYINKDLVGDFVSMKVNNNEELAMYMIGAIMSVVALTGDEELACFMDEDVRKDMVEVRNMINPQLELAESMLNSDIVDYVKGEKISLQKAINLYSHRIRTIIEECEDIIEVNNNFEEEIKEIYERIQIAAKDFKKTLKNMIKVCNLFIEKMYMEA